MLTNADNLNYAWGAYKIITHGGCRPDHSDKSIDICQSILSVKSKVNNARRCPMSSNGWDSPTVSGLYATPAGFLCVRKPTGIITHGGSTMSATNISVSNIAVSKPITKEFNNNTIELYPSKEHEFMMTTKQVAHAYGVSDQNIRDQKSRHKDELLENKHFVSSVRKSDGRGNLKSKVNYWTREGVIMLGFFVKSQNAKEFRIWAANLILDHMEKKPKHKALGKPLELPKEAKPIRTAKNEGMYYDLNRISEIGFLFGSHISLRAMQRQIDTIQTNRGFVFHEDVVVEAFRRALRVMKLRTKRPVLR